MDPPSTAAFNMAADEAALLGHAAGKLPPTLRFYAWNPRAVSIGYFQKATAEIDQAACKINGIDLIRRLTGGRAVLHDAEVTYSLVVKEEAAYVPSTITGSYLFFSRGILSGLARLGVEADIQVPRAAYGQVKKTGFSAACFDAPSHYEITVSGRKVVGSAQVRKEGVLLQHGSILLRFQPELMAAVMRLNTDTERAVMTAELARRAVGLSEVAGRQVGFAEVVDAVRLGIAEECGLDLEGGERPPAETALLQELAEKKYSSAEWNLRR